MGAVLLRDSSPLPVGWGTWGSVLLTNSSRDAEALPRWKLLNYSFSLGRDPFLLIFTEEHSFRDSELTTAQVTNVLAIRGQAKLKSASQVLVSLLW